MSTDLNLIGFRYNIAAAVFFVWINLILHIFAARSRALHLDPYSLAEVPSNIALKLFRPSRWIPTIMVAWGLVMTLMCLINTYQGLITARVFLGLMEAGLFPGVNFYISLWYPSAERSMRIAIFFSAATISGAFGGLLAIGGLHGWQWIFCLEGLATIIVAFAAFFLMYDYPDTASFLTERERSYVIDMLKEDSRGLATHYDFRFVLQALKDYKTYVQVGIYMGLLVPGYAIALFTPTIINELGFSAANAQLLSVPPFVAGCMFTILVGIYSDKHKIRGPYIVGGAFVSLVGYIVLYTQSDPNSSYAGDMKRGVVLAMVIGLGNLGGICSSFVYIDPPRFHIGHGTIMGWLILSILLSVFAMWDYKRLNRQKEELCRERGITEDRRDEFRDMGDESPLFRYTI
ncbi:MFS general substrate transporter [Melanogaster broomeanus]|nr:MFS general substrate transporter [Melanogaster broomeanus]